MDILRTAKSIVAREKKAAQQKAEEEARRVKAEEAYTDKLRKLIFGVVKTIDGKDSFTIKKLQPASVFHHEGQLAEILYQETSIGVVRIYTHHVSFHDGDMGRVEYDMTYVALRDKHSGTILVEVPVTTIEDTLAKFGIALAIYLSRYYE